MVGLNSVNFGLSDHVSISVGLELFSTIASISLGGGFVTGFANIKSGFQVKDKLYLGAGVLAGGAIGNGSFGGVIGYGLATYGSPNSNLTIGVGYGNVDGRWTNAPPITINGMHMLNRKIGLVTENWIVYSKENRPIYDYNSPTGLEVGRWSDVNTTIALSAGIRIISGNITFDLALVSGGEVSKRSYQYTQAPINGIYKDDSRYTDWLPFPVPFLGLVYKF